MIGHEKTGGHLGPVSETRGHAAGSPAPSRLESMLGAYSITALSFDAATARKTRRKLPPQILWMSSAL